MTTKTTTDPRTAVIEVYEAFGRGDLKALLDRIADEVDWGLDPSLPVVAAVPWLANTRSKDDVASVYFGNVAKLDFHAFEPLAIAQDGNQVVTALRISFTVPETGRTIDVLETHYFKVDADGRINYYRPIIDTEAFITAFTER